MNGSYIASIDLLAVDAGGTRTPVALRVDAPVQLSPDEWRCAVRLDGLHDSLVPIHGADSLQALCLALRLVASLLREFVTQGGRLFNADAGADAVEAEWPLEAYFGWLAGARGPAT